MLTCEFTAAIWHWRGPAPYHFVTVPQEDAAAIRSVAAVVSYGWGVIPVTACIGSTEFSTSLFPRDGGYAVPVKDAVRQAEGLQVGDEVMVRLTVAQRR